MMKRIVVPLDGSHRAESALIPAVRFARSNGSTLFLVRATMLPVEYAWLSADTAMILPDAMETEIKQSQAYLDTVAALPLLKDITVTTEVVQGDPAAAILDFAQRREADLILMCSHGERGAKRWLLGSVAQKVAQHSQSPVLIFREEDAPGVSIASEDAVVLVPLDGSTLAEEALQPAIEISHVFSSSGIASLHLLSVLPLFVQEGITDGEASPLLSEAQSYLKNLEERLMRESSASFPVRITSSVCCDMEVGHTILDYSEQGKISQRETPGSDYIAMATHGRKGLAHWAMGSITERVLARTHRPLLIVRPAKLRQTQSVARAPEEATTASKAHGEWQQPFVGLF